jgi:hypothetical protein
VHLDTLEDFRIKPRIVEGDGAVRRESGDSVSDSDESICRIRLILY